MEAKLRDLDRLMGYWPNSHPTIALWTAIDPNINQVIKLEYGNIWSGLPPELHLQPINIRLFRPYMIGRDTHTRIFSTHDLQCIYAIDQNSITTLNYTCLTLEDVEALISMNVTLTSAIRSAIYYINGLDQQAVVDISSCELLISRLCPNPYACILDENLIKTILTMAQNNNLNAVSRFKLLNIISSKVLHPFTPLKINKTTKYLVNYFPTSAYKALTRERNSSGLANNWYTSEEKEKILYILLRQNYDNTVPMELWIKIIEYMRFHRK